MVSTSAGMRCPECAYVSGFTPSAAVKQDTDSRGFAAISALLIGLAGAYLTAFLASIYPILAIITAPVYGRFVAKAIRSFSGDDKTQTSAAIGVGSILLGALLAFGMPFGKIHDLSAQMSMPVQAMVGLSIGIAVAICYHHLKPKSS